MSKDYTPDKLIDLALLEVLNLAYKNNPYAFQPCGSNGGDAVHYYYRLKEGAGISFSNHGYIDMVGLKPYTEGLYKPKLVEW